MTSGGRFTASVLLALMATASVSSGQGRDGAVLGLSRAQDLRPIYDAILNADVFETDRLLTRGCSPAPAEACLVLGAVSVWWQIQLDPHSRALDAVFHKKVDAAILAVEAWTAREPRRAEAWFYLGGAYGARVQWRVLRGEHLAAARDGKQAKESLERALALAPKMYDAYFGIGLYHYYADVAPTVARMVRWLLLLPGGDRTRGLGEMLEARNRGALLGGEADYQLHLIYLWYEESPARALELLNGLRARYWRNPLFVSRVAAIQDVYLHDHAASLATFQSLLDQVRLLQVNSPGIAEVHARLGLAGELDHLYETDAAIDELRRVMASRATAPFGGLARASLALGLAQDRLGARQTAVTSYRSALEFARREDLGDLEDEARAALRRTPPDPRIAEAYRLSLQAWRLLQSGDLERADTLMRRALELNPDDPVAEFRHGKLHAARGAPDAALASYERVIRAQPVAPPTFRADAYLEAGRLHESRQRLQAAAEMYQSAVGLRGAAEHTRDAARRSLARIQSTDATPPAS